MQFPVFVIEIKSELCFFSSWISAQISINVEIEEICSRQSEKNFSFIEGIEIFDSFVKLVHTTDYLLFKVAVTYNIHSTDFRVNENIREEWVHRQDGGNDSQNGESDWIHIPEIWWQMNVAIPQAITTTSKWSYLSQYRKIVIGAKATKKGRSSPSACWQQGHTALYVDEHYPELVSRSHIV